MKRKNQQYNKLKRRTLQKIGQSKESHLQAIRASQLAIQAVLGAMQMAVLLSTPKPRFDKGNVFTPVSGIVGETGPEMIVTGKCEHDYEFDKSYSGYCPQPKQCTKCGHYDMNGFTGNRFNGF